MAAVRMSTIISMRSHALQRQCTHTCGGLPAAGVPCPPHTQMVGIACSPEEYAQLQADTKANKRQKAVKYAIAGAAGVAVVTGAAVLLSVGNLGMTLQNIPFDAFSGDCCECCGECCGSLLGGGCVVS